MRGVVLCGGPHNGEVYQIQDGPAISFPRIDDRRGDAYCSTYVIVEPGIGLYVGDES